MTASAVICVASGLLILVRTVPAFWSLHSELPGGDQWTFVLSDLGAWTEGRLRPSDLWRAHNEHRIVTTRLLLWADVLWFHGRNVLPVAALPAIQLAHLGGLVALVVRERRLPPAQRALLAGVLAAALLSATQMENFTLGFQIQFLLVFALGTLACWCCAQVLTPAPDAGSARRWLAGALLAAVVASFTMANGLLLFPVLFGLLVAGRAGRGSLGAVGASAALTLLAYLPGYRTPGHHSSLAAVVTQPLQVLRYAGLYLASFVPSARPGPTQPGSTELALVALAGGLGLLATAALCILLLWRRARCSPLLGAAVGSCAFLAGTAVITAAGRAVFPSKQMVVSRYHTPALLFWSLLLIAVLLVLHETPQTRRVSAAACVLAALALVLVILPAQDTALLTRANEKARKDLVVLALRLGAGDDEVFAVVAREPERLRSGAEILRANGLSLYARDEEVPLGRRLQDVASPADQPCAGDLNEVAPLPVGEYSKVSGWAFDPRDREHFAEVLLVDQEGVVRGVARHGHRRSDVQARVPAAGERAGWSGYVLNEYGQDVTAFGVRQDGEACRIGPL